MTDADKVRKLEAEVKRLMERVEKIERQIGKLPLRIAAGGGGGGMPVWSEYSGP